MTNVINQYVEVVLQFLRGGYHVIKTSNINNCSNV